MVQHAPFLLKAEEEKLNGVSSYLVSSARNFDFHLHSSALNARHGSLCSVHATPASDPPNLQRRACNPICRQGVCQGDYLLGVRGMRLVCGTSKSGKVVCKSSSSSPPQKKIVKLWPYSTAGTTALFLLLLLFFVAV